MFILLLKTHKLTVLITAPSTSTIDDVKTEALDALTSDVLTAPNPHGEYAMEEDPSEWEVPKVSSKDDFELARAVKEKQRPTGRYETLDTEAQLKSVLTNWDPVFIQFKDADGEWCCPNDTCLNYILVRAIHVNLFLIVWCVICSTQADCFL